MSIGREYYDEEGNNQQILEKLDANLPALKEDYEKVRDGWLTVASDETISTPTGVAEAKKYVYGGSQQLTQNLPKLTQFYQNLHEIIVSFMLTIGIKFCTLL